MTTLRCKNGHSYDDTGGAGCPYCGVPLDIGHTRRLNDPPAATAPDDDGKTRYLWQRSFGGQDPVVGWLVCIAGPDRGRDYRLHTERNFIGRSPTMDVTVANDRAISEIRHAAISHNPRNNGFRIEPGASRGIVYLNGEEVSAAMPLAAYDRIALGETELLFVPFCGERFDWNKPAHRTAQAPSPSTEGDDFDWLNTQSADSAKPSRKHP